MQEKAPEKEVLTELIGDPLYNVWTRLCSLIEERYDMERLWNKGNTWKYEYKYRLGGKTLCGLYAKENSVGFMIIFGKYEREKFENERQNYSEKVQEIYDEAKTYRDGKWVMFPVTDTSLFADFMKLLAIKRKPKQPA